MKKASVAKSAVMLFAVLCAAFAFGCVSPEDYEGGKLPALGAPQPAEVDYTDALKNFDFDYSFAVPGGTLGYDHLIFGRNIKNDGEGREFYTFATQYMAPDDGYYLAYMRTSAMDECKENLQEIEDGWSA